MGSRARSAVIAGTTSLLVGATATFGAGSAAAEPAPAKLPLTPECGDTVKGEPGTAVKVAGVKLGEIPESGQEKLVGQIPIVGGLLGGTSLTKCTVTAVAEVSEPVAQPMQQLTEAAEPVTKNLPDPVSNVVGNLTGQSASSEPQAQAVPQPGPQTVQQQSRSPVREQPTLPPQQFGPFLPTDFNFGAIQQGVYDFGDVSYFDYSSLFATSLGMFGGTGGGFGQLPRGDLFGSAGFGFFGPTATERDVAAAGSAQVLPTQDTDRVALPILVAVLALSGVSAALVRAWVHGTGRA